MRYADARRVNNAASRLRMAFAADVARKAVNAFVRKLDMLKPKLVPRLKQESLIFSFQYNRVTVRRRLKPW